MELIDKLAVTSIRMLTVDAIQKAKSGHPGLAIDAAPMAYSLWKQMRHDPKRPDWLGRDRFVLSAGHASMLLYSLMHIFGYDVSIADIAQFRQLRSKTAGHPEFGHIPGIEATTGPLGQGFAMAVGMAMAERHMASVFNRDGYPVIDNYTYTIMGDGCMMEGVVSEAASLAGTLKLNKLIALYDSNRITIEGSTDVTFTENVAARFAAYGWQVITVENGESMDAVTAALIAAKQEKNRPSLIIVHTNIAQGTPKEGSASSHGAPLGEDNIRIYKESLGWSYAPFTVPGEVYDHMAKLQRKYLAVSAEYDGMLDSYRSAYPELYTQLQCWISGKLPEGIEDDTELWSYDEKPLATRKTSEIMLGRLSERLPNLVGGSADLAPSNLTYLKDKGDFSSDNYGGRNIHFGIREFAMAAIANGMSLYGGLRPYCATFLVFADYLKPAARLSALMNRNVLYILTHDSIGVGEDGPTHQPIEQLDMLRATPNTYVFRPADGRETTAAYLSALKLNAPAIMALSRQNLPQLEGTGRDAMRGGYVLRDTCMKPDVILMGCGSEVSLLLKAADILSVQGILVKIVSMPCMELFDEQPEEYRNTVLPPDVRNRIACEALGGKSWYKYLGLDGRLVSMNSFGTSAPAGKVFEAFGITAESIAAAALKIVNV